MFASDAADFLGKRPDPARRVIDITKSPEFSHRTYSKVMWESLDKSQCVVWAFFMQRQVGTTGMNTSNSLLCTLFCIAA